MATEDERSLKLRVCSSSRVYTAPNVGGAEECEDMPGVFVRKKKAVVWFEKKEASLLSTNSLS